MKRVRQTVWVSFCLLFLLVVFISVLAKDRPKPSDESSEEKEPFKPFAEVIKDTEKFQGLFTLYKSREGKVYFEIEPAQLSAPFLMTITLSQGVGEKGLLAGIPLDELLFKFERVNDNVQLVRQNPYFKAQPQSPLSLGVAKDFSVSVLDSLKILSIHSENKALLVDATSLFLSDSSDLVHLVNQNLHGTYNFESSKSYVKKLQAFPLNVEADVLATLSANAPPKENALLDTLPDWRNIQLGIHYSFSQLPTSKTAYVPRLADDRVGYFLTAMKDFSSMNPDSPIVRYINRWNLAKKPIVFWIENTTPLEYRQAIQEGVLEWNKAFDKIGIPNAVEVKIQPENSTWDPLDVRYNVIHWISSSHGHFAAVGPSRVNPLTGEIYNASVVIDGESIRRIRLIYQYELSLRDSSAKYSFRKGKVCSLPALKAHEAMQGAVALWLLSNNLEEFKVPEDFIHDYIKDLVMHEIGHCFGLRHNFHGSTLLSLKELEEPTITKKTALSASVMDYVPINISPKGEKQGEFFSSTIGVYDYWAIRYGYAESQAKFPEEEKEMLSKIADESSKNHDFAYETDEDTYSPFSLDPLSMDFDLSKDPLGFVKNRYELYRELFLLMHKKLPVLGKSYNQIRRAFDLVMSGYQSYLDIPLRFIGGEYFSRNHKGKIHSTSPFKPVSKVEQLRALQILNQYVFGENAFPFSSDFLNKLAPDRNSDHFTELQVFLTPLNYPIREKIDEIQSVALSSLFKPVLFNRLLNEEYASSNLKDAFTLNNLFGWMTTNFWSELDKAKSIQETRKELQRNYLNRLIGLMTEPKPQLFSVPELEVGPLPIAEVPEEAKILAEYHLILIRGKIEKVLRSGKPLDLETKNHLESSLRLIRKAFEAKLFLKGVTAPD